MKYRGIFEYEYPTEHKPPISIDVHLHGDCIKGKIIEWEYRPLEQEPRKGHWIEHPHEAGPNWEYSRYECSECHDWAEDDSDYCPYCGAKMIEPQKSEE